MRTDIRHQAAGNGLPASRPASRASRLTPRGFTLVEVMIGSALAAVVMAAVLSSFVFLGRNLTRLANYHSLETKSREGLAYLSRDLTAAQSVKAGTTPTASSLTLVLSAGEVTYTFDSVNQRLRRQATFGANRDFYLLTSAFCTCPSFTFGSYTATGGDATSQVSAGVLIPYSIKQVEVRYTLSSPATFASGTRASYDAISPRFVLRNRQLPDGS